MKTQIKQRQNRGFSLIELVIVIVIMGVISAIAIPRLSRGSRNAGSSALKGNLATMRNALELYAAEHEGKYPDAAIALQLTQFSDIAGANPSTTKTGASIYGPYIVEVPGLPVGTKKGATAIVIEADGAVAPPGGAATDGWWYNSATNVIRANLANTEVDNDTKIYNAY